MASLCLGLPSRLCGHIRQARLCGSSDRSGVSCAVVNESRVCVCPPILVGEL